MSGHARKRTGNVLSEGLGSFYDLIISFTDILFGVIQRIVGVRGMPYIFVLPNLLIFGIFILFPMLT